MIVLQFSRLSAPVADKIQSGHLIGTISTQSELVR